MRGLFVTGTDTGVGKTQIAAAIAARLVAEGRQVGVLKPLATGVEPGGDCEDARILAAAAGGDVPLDRVAPIQFAAPLAPSVAARLEGRILNTPHVIARARESIAWWQARGAAGIIIEGVGGLLCPIANTMTVADLAFSLGFPVLIVARRGLGTLNHTLLTVEVARMRGLNLAGIILNGAEPTTDAQAEATNRGELTRQLGYRCPGILAEIPHGLKEDLLNDCMGMLNWWDRLEPTRGGLGT